MITTVVTTQSSWSWSVFPPFTASPALPANCTFFSSCFIELYSLLCKSIPWYCFSIQVKNSPHGSLEYCKGMHCNLLMTKRKIDQQKQVMHLSLGAAISRNTFSPYVHSGNLFRYIQWIYSYSVSLNRMHCTQKASLHSRVKGGNWSCIQKYNYMVLSTKSPLLNILMKCLTLSEGTWMVGFSNVCIIFCSRLT